MKTLCVVTSVILLLCAAGSAQIGRDGCGDGGSCLATCTFTPDCMSCHNGSNGQCFPAGGCYPQAACWTSLHAIHGRESNPPAASRIHKPEGVPPLSEQGLAAKKLIAYMEQFIGHPLVGAELHQALGVENYGYGTPAGLAFEAPQTPQHPVVEVPMGTVVIDGSKTPEAFSDSLALRLFYQAAKSQTSSSAANQTSQFKSAQTFLDKLTAAAPADSTLLKGRIAAWAAKYSVSYTLNNPAVNTPRYYEDLENDSAAELAALKTSLSAKGMALLLEELKRRKSTIQQFKFPPMGH